MSLAIAETAGVTKTLESTKQAFAEEVLTGLTARRKYLPSKYLYNKRGEEVFWQIRVMLVYYLTYVEHKVFSTRKADEQLSCLGNKIGKVVLFLGADIGNFSEK